jgi:hypothetical protein
MTNKNSRAIFGYDVMKFCDRCRPCAFKPPLCICRNVMGKDPLNGVYNSIIMNSNMNGKSSHNFRERILFFLDNNEYR